MNVTFNVQLVLYFRRLLTFVFVSYFFSQQCVFNDLGKGVLYNAWKGYNCSLFAYGQTGSGKSYSMVGYGANKGIVPLACEELFKGIEEKRKQASKDEDYQVILLI